MKTIELVMKNRDQFSNEFIDWLPNNAFIWMAFEVEAEKVINAGFKHYSARTIVHVIRHHSALVEQGSNWKINNNISPYLARLFALKYPKYAEFFGKRQTPKAIRDAMQNNWLELNNGKLFK